MPNEHKHTNQERTGCLENKGGFASPSSFFPSLTPLFPLFLLLLRPQLQDLSKDIT